MATDLALNSSNASKEQLTLNDSLVNYAQNKSDGSVAFT